MSYRQEIVRRYFLLARPVHIYQLSEICHYLRHKIHLHSEKQRSTQTCITKPLIVLRKIRTVDSSGYCSNVTPSVILYVQFPDITMTVMAWILQVVYHNACDLFDAER